MWICGPPDIPVQELFEDRS
ncbi:unnamed protein product [Callosobruchus maculatus]|uniref:Uncharacterized protein n=1 Tax=Callosobruchus maculatus TaxID=64391 RepID=A0A653D1W4_CALMS|nr:unnamed protein product [Callosobruchus maculatus]